MVDLALECGKEEEDSGGLSSRVECEGKGGAAPGFKPKRLGGGWLWLGRWDSLGWGGGLGGNWRRTAGWGGMELSSSVALVSFGREQDL